MKITTDTPDLLIVDDRPVVLGVVLMLFTLTFVGIGLAVTFDGSPAGLLFAVFGGGLGLLFFWIFVRRAQLVFHRPEGWVEIRRRNLFGGSKQRFRLDEIERAEVEESSGSEGGVTYRVVLAAHGESAGLHPFTLAYSNVGRHHEIAARINQWLGGER